mgnify:CR=1 FL=1
MIKLLISDDHQMFIDGLKSILNFAEDVEVVGQAMTGREVLDFCDRSDVDIVIMDINMPEMDGIETTKKLVSKHPKVKILGLSMHNDRSFISDMLKAGAHGYILKNTGMQDLFTAIKSLHEGENYLGDEVKQTLLNSFIKNQFKTQISEKLSEREFEVLESIASGLTTNEIANQLFISKNTVETHRKNLLYKLNAKNTAELVKNAYKKRLIQ